MILSLDLSLTETGYCLYDSEVVRADIIVAKTREDPLRMQIIEKQIKDLIYYYNPSIVVIEKTTNRAISDGQIRNKALNWIVQLMLHKKGLEYVLVQNKTLKKWATGNGNANKPMMKEACKNITGYETDNDNIADAILLGVYYEAQAEK